MNDKQPLDHTPASVQPKQQFIMPWPVIMFIVGVAIGFIFGVTR